MGPPQSMKLMGPLVANILQSFFSFADHSQCFMLIHLDREKKEQCHCMEQGEAALHFFAEKNDFVSEFELIFPALALLTHAYCRLAKASSEHALNFIAACPQCRMLGRCRVWRLFGSSLLSELLAQAGITPAKKTCQ